MSCLKQSRPCVSDAVSCIHDDYTEAQRSSHAGMGCSAGIIAIDLADRLLKLSPNKHALVLSTENITQNWCAVDCSVPVAAHPELVRSRLLCSSCCSLCAGMAYKRLPSILGASSIRLYDYCACFDTCVRPLPTDILAIPQCLPIHTALLVLAHLVLC